MPSGSNGVNWTTLTSMPNRMKLRYCLLFLGLTAVLSHCKPEKNVDFKLRFKNVTGLKLQDGLTVDGLVIGEVTQINLAKDYSVIVSIKLKENQRLPLDSKFEIQSVNHLGEKEIQLQLGLSTVCIQPIDTLDGESETIVKSPFKDVKELLNSYGSKLSTSQHDSLLNEIERLRNIIDSTEALELK
jgi:ABC-type transporter Mla subunit MlaD